MSNLSAATPRAGVVTDPIVTAKAATVALLATTAFLALALFYFIGIDEGAYSMFGDTAVLHEFFHDGRHFLGFPCH